MLMPKVCDIQYPMTNDHFDQRLEQFPNPVFIVATFARTLSNE